MKTLDRLVAQLARLPGIGPKTAERLAYHLLKAPREEVLALAECLQSLKQDVRECALCFNYADGDLCSICADPGRDRTLVCVVEQPKELFAIEQTGRYRGTYHVLGGSFSPIEERGPVELRLATLVERIQKDRVAEVILATNPDFEGDGTALLVSDALRSCGVRLTRIARGVPSGSHLEHMNRAIIGDALEGRTELQPPSVGARGASSLPRGQE